MNWATLICDKRLGMEEFHDPRVHIRSDFQRDYDRMIFSSPFRRLQNKTQVFPLPGSVFVHNRLTHSLEVSSVGRSLSRRSWRVFPGVMPTATWRSRLPVSPTLWRRLAYATTSVIPLRAFRRDDDINMVQRGGGIATEG